MEMVEVKTAELSGAALDWAVGKVCAGENWGNADFREGWMRNWKPSTDWSQGGPLIEKYSVSVDIRPFTRRWDAYCSGWANDSDTPLIAACRAIVAAKLGETVSVPKELLP